MAFLLVDFRLKAYPTSGLMLLQLGEGDCVSLNVPQCALAGSSLSSSWTTFPSVFFKLVNKFDMFSWQYFSYLKIRLLLKENHSLLQTFKSTNRREGSQNT